MEYPRLVGWVILDRVGDELGEHRGVDDDRDHHALIRCLAYSRASCMQSCPSRVHDRACDHGPTSMRARASGLSGGQV